MKQQMKTNQIEWKDIDLGNKEYFEITMGQSPSGDTYNTKKEGTPFFQGKAEFGKKYPSVEKWTTKPCKFAKPGDILMSVRAPVGTINMSDIGCCIGRGLASIRCKREIEKDFVYYFLKLNEVKIEKLGSGSTFKAITSKQLLNIKIPLPFSNGKPDLIEQERIVKILEKSDMLKERGRNMGDLLDESLKSIFYEMFLKEKNKFDEVEFDNGKYFLVQSGGTPPKSKKEYWKNGTIPWIGSTTCKDLPIYEAEQSITKEGLKNSSAKLFSKETVLIALVGATIGKTGFLKFDCATNQNIAGITIKDKERVNSIYLFYSVKQLYSKFVALSSDTFKMATLSFIRSLKIPLPPLSLQQKFAKIVEHVEKMKENVKKTKQNAEELFNSLLSKAFRGEL